jgi:RTX calcium-binding nonapeptide repeat (4 copies)
VGGAGNDTLNGGTGNDTYRFTNAGDGIDVIGGNFTIGNPASNANADKLDLRDVLGGVPGLAAAVQADNAGVVGTYVLLTVSSGVATLAVDVDGAGAGGVQTLATFNVGGSINTANILTTLLSNNQIIV